MPERLSTRPQAGAISVRDDILEVARREFETHGLSGARIDAIAEQTRTTKRMIYYYFGSKEGLYSAVLEGAYARVYAISSSVDVDALTPAEAIRTLVSKTVDYTEANPGFLRLVSIENLNNARYLTSSETVRAANLPVIHVVERVIARGLADGSFKRRLDPVEAYLLISAACFYRVSNRLTFSSLYDYDFAGTADRHKALIADSLIALLGTAPAEAEVGANAG